MLNNCIVNLLTELLVGREAAGPGGQSAGIIVDTAACISGHPAQELSLEDLAAQAALSPFSFRLSATALRIDSKMIVDIAVEYGESSTDRNKLIGNVWARQEGGRSAVFPMSVHLPAKSDEAPKEQVDRVFGALNDNGGFNAKLVDFITEQITHSA